MELLEELDHQDYKGGRNDSRKDRKLLVAYEIDDYLHKDVTRDISNTGVFIETHSPPAIGEDITLSFSFSEGKKSVKISGRVVRSTPNGFAVKFQRRSRK
jgi:Tfp pilus assembly protein PilZ